MLLRGGRCQQAMDCSGNCLDPNPKVVSTNGSNEDKTTFTMDCGGEDDIIAACRTCK